jgi:hypothetical protein
LTTDPLAPLLVKWLTHDFATPIATVMTASELLGDTADAEINGLITDAARRLAGRLQLVRAALAPGSSPMSASGLEKLLRAGLEGTPLVFDFGSDFTASGPQAALIAGAAMLLADLRRGQPLVVGRAGAHWTAPAALPETVVAAINGAPAGDSRSALATMVVRAAATAGMALQITDNGLAWPAI